MGKTTKTDTIVVRLSWSELADAARSAIQTEAAREQRGITETHGAANRPLWDRRITGACGEMAVAKHLDHYWMPGETFTYGDVGRLEVRTTWHANGRLLLHNTDNADAAYINVTKQGTRTFTLVGWIKGSDGMTQRYWNADMPTACYAIPNQLLQPMSSLPHARGAA